MTPVQRLPVSIPHSSHLMQRPVRLLLLALLLGSAAVAQEGVDNSVVGEPDGGNPLLSSEGSVSERVTKFYELYLPAKVPALKKIFFRYKATGGDEKLLADLKSKCAQHMMMITCIILYVGGMCNGPPVARARCGSHGQVSCGGVDNFCVCVRVSSPTPIRATLTAQVRW